MQGEPVQTPMRNPISLPSLAPVSQLAASLRLGAGNACKVSRSYKSFSQRFHCSVGAALKHQVRPRTPPHFGSLCLNDLRIDSHSVIVSVFLFIPLVLACVGQVALQVRRS
jgi:hypothetical protein